VGGGEHAVLHLLYARFWHKVLFDLGKVKHPEPFMKLVHQGMILGEIEYTLNRLKESGAPVDPREVEETDQTDVPFVHAKTKAPIITEKKTEGDVEKAG